MEFDVSRRAPLSRAARLLVLGWVAVAGGVRAYTAEPAMARAVAPEAASNTVAVAGPGASVARAASQSVVAPRTASTATTAARPKPSAVAARDPAAQRLFATARMWSTKHRDDLASQAIYKALLIAPNDPALLAEQVRIELRLGHAQAAQTTLARLQRSAPGAASTQQIEDEFRAATDGRQELATVRLLARSGQSAEAA